MSDNYVRFLDASKTVTIIGKDTLAVGDEVHYSCESGESNPASDVTLVVMDQDGKNVPAKQTKMKKAVGDGFVTGSIHSFKINNRVKKLFMECKAVNQVGMAITDKVVNITCKLIFMFMISYSQYMQY